MYRIYAWSFFFFFPPSFMFHVGKWGCENAHFGVRGGHECATHVLCSKSTPNLSGGCLSGVPYVGIAFIGSKTLGISKSKEKKNWCENSIWIKSFSYENLRTWRGTSVTHPVQVTHLRNHGFKICHHFLIFGNSCAPKILIRAFQILWSTH